MNPTGTRAFAHQLMVYLIVIFCLGGSIGLGAGLLRYQIALTVKRNHQLAADIALVERRIFEVSTLIESAQVPATLRKLNTDLALGLVPLSEPQVVRVAIDPGLRLATRQSRELFKDVAVPTAFRVSFAR